MKENVMEKYKAIAGYAAQFGVKASAEKFGVSVMTVRNALARTGQKPLNAAQVRYKDIEVRAREVGETMSFDEFYDSLDVDIPKDTVRGYMYRHGFKFKKNKRGVRGPAWNRRDVDVEHMRKYAPDYTITEYIRKFNPSCSRATLINRAKEYGIVFLKRCLALPDDIVSKAEAINRTMTLQEFYDKYVGPDIMAFDDFSDYCKRHKYKFARKKMLPREKDYTPEEIMIVEKYYPTMGSRCVEYLPGRTPHSVMAFASRRGIKCTDHYWLKKKKD